MVRLKVRVLCTDSAQETKAPFQSHQGFLLNQFYLKFWSTRTIRIPLTLQQLENTVFVSPMNGTDVQNLGHFRHLPSLLPRPRSSVLQTWRRKMANILLKKETAQPNRRALPIYHPSRLIRLVNLDLETGKEHSLRIVFPRCSIVGFPLPLRQTPLSHLRGNE